MTLREELERFRHRVGVPAVVGALVTADSLAIDAVGVTRRGGDEPVSVDDQWHIGSCAKSVTAALYARLVEQGRASWGTPLPELFPDLTDRIHSGWTDRSIDDVLHCRSGMRANLSLRAMRAGWSDDRPLTEQRTDAVVAGLAEAPGPKGKFVYSNLGYITAGAAIDRLAGVPYESALEREIIAPLGISSLGFGPPDRIWGHGPRLQLGGLCLFRGRPADPGRPRSDNPAVLSSAGTLHVGVGDWARFFRLFMTGGGGLLESSSIEHLLRVPEGKGQPMSMGWSRASFDGASFGVQGSNARWVATGLLDESRERASLVVTNDGRTSVLMRSVGLARRLWAAY